MTNATLSTISSATGTRCRRIGADWIFISDTQFSWAIPAASLEQRADAIIGAPDRDEAYDALVAVPATIGTHVTDDSWAQLPEDARRDIVEGALLGERLLDIIGETLS